ncbi:hypothetical protein ACN9MH_18540 [Paenibacillus silvae]|uniref:hypothetical protein n=1 Tax=Paenibacillus TaxID=44249 RepID=UPI001C0FAD22|nr:MULTISPECIES: hypothetical protein [Paenibacillus]MBU5352439.1 hypothetical protein [Paenibacillus barcinonensis]MDM5276840.1 hypothetical protein [Paenibacillus silvae]
MSQPLSRMKTYGSQRQRHSDKKEKIERRTVSQTSLVAETAAAAETGGTPPITSITLPRSQRQSYASALESPVLPQRAPSRSKKTGNQQEDSVSEARSLPTRTELHPSRRLRLSKRFVNSLIFIFIMLTVGLVWWGIKGAPPLNTFLPLPW